MVGDEKAKAGDKGKCRLRGCSNSLSISLSTSQDAILHLHNEKQPQSMAFSPRWAHFLPKYFRDPSFVTGKLPICQSQPLMSHQYFFLSLSKSNCCLHTTCSKSICALCNSPAASTSPDQLLLPGHPSVGCDGFRGPCPCCSSLRLSGRANKSSLPFTVIQTIQGDT